ncbi:hypothetical protein C2W64_04886 [Brevibacillus laterosporus]|nr:hypothetical protein C2W64_04886 [Brevibacillus laterosporus]
MANISGRLLAGNQQSDFKMMHPGFGALNAQEWYVLVEMHYRHHLLQKND